MEGSRLAELLSSLSKNEMKDFERFINSPFHVKGLRVNYGAVRKFYSMILSYYPEFSSRNLEKERIFSRLFPGKNYNDTSMRQLMQAMSKLCEEFMIYSELRSDGYTKEVALLSSLRKRKLDKMFMQHTKAAGKIVENSSRDADYFYRKQYLTIITNDFCVFRHKLQEMYDPQKAIEQFVCYFLAQALQYYRITAINESLWNIRYEKPFFKEVVDFLKQNPDYLRKYFYIRLGYYQLLVNLELNDQNFYELKTLKDDKQTEQLTGESLHSLYSNLNGYCIIRIRNGDIKFRHEKLKLDIEILTKGIFSKTDYITMNDYLSCTINSIFLKEYEWTKRFQNAYNNRLDPKHYEFVTNYVDAELEFSMGNYARALEHLSRIKVEYSHDKINLKFLTMKIYYETGNTEEILYMADSLKHSVKEDALLTPTQKQFSNKVIKLFQKIALLNSKEKGNLLLKELNSSKHFRHREWFVEKAEEYIKPSRTKKG
ncbi:MAG: hypothetical protein HOP31_09790 [Ignavibacteria bacterium]|nr:hypothetical protein [Ignavibacteria bacterium]